MKNIKKLACGLSLMLALSSASVLADTNNDSKPDSSKKVPVTGIVWETPTTGTFLEDAYSNDFRYEDGYLVRRRYIKLSEDSIGKTQNNVLVAYLTSRGGYSSELPISNTMSISEDDLQVKTGLGISDTHREIVKTELENVVEEHFGWDITKTIPAQTVFTYTSSESGNVKSIHLGFKKEKYAVRVDIVELVASDNGKSHWDFVHMRSHTGTILVPEPVISYNYAKIISPIETKSNVKAFENFESSRK